MIESGYCRHNGKLVTVLNACNKALDSYFSKDSLIDRSLKVISYLVMVCLTLSLVSHTKESNTCIHVLMKIPEVKNTSNKQWMARHCY